MKALDILRAVREKGVFDGDASGALEELEEYIADMDKYLDYTTNGACSKSVGADLGAIKAEHDRMVKKMILASSHEKVRPYSVTQTLMPCPYGFDGASEMMEQDLAQNNGGNTDYYRIPNGAKMAQDIIEMRDMNFAQGNIFKAAFTFNTGRHDGTDYVRELNKIIWFAQRELERERTE